MNDGVSVDVVLHAARCCLSQQEGNTGRPRFGIQRLKCAVCNMRLSQYPCFLSQSSSASRTMSTSFRRSSKAYLRRRSDNDRDMLYIFLWSFFSGRDYCISVFIVFCICVLLEVCIPVTLGSVLANSPLGLPFFTWFFPLSPSPIASLRSFQKFGSKGRIVFCAVTAPFVAEHILPITGGFRKAHIVPDTG